MSPVKEPHYLCHHHLPETFSGPGDEGFSHGVVRSLPKYEQLFTRVNQESIVGEASVYYLYYPDTAERIKEFNPDAKVILILRNPVDRAFSAYLHTVRDGRETLSFEQALREEPRRRESGYQPLWWYKEVGLYSSQVQRYLETFDQGHLRIFLYEDFKSTELLLQNVLSFLRIDTQTEINTSAQHNVSGVPRAKWAYNFFSKPNPVKQILKALMPEKLAHQLGERAKNMTLQKVTMAENTRKQLQDYFRSDIQSLQSMIGRDLSSWVNVTS